MAKIEIYTWSTCPFCKRAKKLLDRKKVAYIEYDITGNEADRTKMMDRTGGSKSVPQIFINDQYIGGCDDLHDLDYDGKLNPLLQD